MALTFSRVTEVCEHVKSACDDAKALHYKLKELLDTNSDLSIDWGGDPKPDYINEDVDGNVDGFKFTRAEISNVINSLDQLRKTLDNEAVSQGDHLGNINKIADSSA